MEETHRKRQGARSPVTAYLDELAERTQRLLGRRLIGIYAGGSLAFGDYQPDRSDIDVAIVVDRELEVDTKEGLVAALRHEVLPCPARGLELVVYSRAAADTETTDADFELNLNTGAGMPFRKDLEPDPTEAHWFALDRAILRTRGLALVGPPAADVFAPIPREQMLGVTARSLRWYELGAARTDDAILNACRALRFAREDEWSSKREAGRWALGEVVDRLLVSHALAARCGGDLPDLGRALAFVAAARSELEAASALHVA